MGVLVDVGIGVGVSVSVGVRLAVAVRVEVGGAAAVLVGGWVGVFVDAGANDPHEAPIIAMANVIKLTLVGEFLIWGIHLPNNTFVSPAAVLHLDSIYWDGFPRPAWRFVA